MSASGSLRDTLLVARFEVLRAVRTWQALALVAVYVVAMSGGAYTFIEALGAIEGKIAEGMGVPVTRWPGTLAEELRNSEQIGEMLSFLTGDPEVGRRLREVPLLALFLLWEGVGLVPFLAATTASEALAGDVRSRAIRFEAQRTGRAELVLGRFLGQLFLMGVASVIAVAAVGGLGLGLMAKQDPFALGAALVAYGARVVLFAVPFVGLGVSLSALTASPAWARLGAILVTAASWIAYGLCQVPTDGWTAVLADLVLPLLPQHQISALWRGGTDLALAAVVLVALGLGALGLGLWRFSSRDL